MRKPVTETRGTPWRLARARFWWKMHRRDARRCRLMWDTPDVPAMIFSTRIERFPDTDGTTVIVRTRLMFGLSLADFWGALALTIGAFALPIWLFCERG